MLDVKKLLKKAIKRKIRITDALIVGFLISGNLLYAEDFTNDEVIEATKTIKEEGPIIINGSTDENKENYNGRVLKAEDSLTNQGTISAKVIIENITTPTILTEDITTTKVNESGNGVIGNVSNNNGVISGYIDVTGGQVNPPVSADNTSITKSDDGIRDYNIELNESGNGVIGNVSNNNGVILGFANVSANKELDYACSLVNKSGNGVIGNVSNNNGVISGYTNTENKLVDGKNFVSSNEFSGNGIYGNLDNNNGVISGYAINEGRFESYWSNNGVIGNVSNNNGVISGYVNDSSTAGDYYNSNNGIYGNVENNNGVITGYQNIKIGSLTALYSGNGISGNVENNNGVISGYTYIDYLDGLNVVNNIFFGNGIAASEDTGVELTNDITNSGLIKGSHIAIAAQSITRDVNNYGIDINNYGILAGRAIFSNFQEVIYTGEEVGQQGNLESIDIGENNNNLGLQIKLASEMKEGKSDETTGNVSIDGNGKPIIESIAMGKGGKVTVGGVDKTIVNGTSTGALNTASGTSTTDTDLYVNSSNLNENSNLIINGVGRNTGALTVNTDTFNLDNSIINGYETALYVKDGKSFTGNNVIFNGGGLKNDIAVIKGDDGANTLNILGNSIINGAVDLGAGNDNLLVSNGTQINGDLDGGAGDKDKLQLGNGTLNMEHPLNNHNGNGDTKIDEGDYRGLAIYHEIKNFENIDIKGAVTLYETAKITGDSNIHIKENSSLNLRIDPTKKDSKDRIIGHALYTAGDKTITGEIHTGNGTITEYEREDGETLNGGTLNIITNGIGVGGVIAMSELNLPKVALLENTDTNIGTTNLDSNLYVRTDSIIHSATVHTGNESKIVDYSNAQVGDIKVTVDPDLFELIPPVDPEPPIDPIDPEPPVNKYQPRYTQLNKIYKSLIADEDNINAIYPTTSITLLKQYLNYPVQNESTITDMALGNLLTLLNEIYTASPYSFSSELSRESMGLYSDAIIDNPFKAREKEWMVYGGLLHESADLKDRYYGKNYHGFDTTDKITNVKVDNKITGAYALGEYGIDSTLSVGGILGGSKNKSDISNGSNLDGNSFYIGGYFKKDIEELRVIGGIGYQYTDYDAKRVAGNMMQSFSYDNDYSDNGLNIYLSGRYNYALGNDFYLVPKAKLSYTYIDQDSVNEGDKPLAMNIDSKSFDVFEGLIGVDLKKEFLHESGKSALKVGVAYKRILSGYEDDYLTANMKNGSDFDLLVPDKVKNNYIVGVGYEYESQKGILFNVNGSYSFDVKENNSTKDNSRTKNSANGWSVGVGIGYKLP